MDSQSSAVPVVDSAKQHADRWPSQIKYIVGNEACERFSYYGMRSILAGYITGQISKGGLGQTTDVSTEIIHLFVFVNYFMPLLGAWLSDRIIGRYRTILWVSLFYCAGHGVLACSDFAHDAHGKLLYLYVGLALIAFGSGGIKPCVSAFMGDQFRSDQSHLLQKAYGAFYWAINFGSFFAFLVIPWIKDKHGYSPAFAVPGILMAIATVIFWLGTKHYVRVPASRETRKAGFVPVFMTAFSGTSGGRTIPALNLLASLGLPLLIMIVLTAVALAPSNSTTVAIGKLGLGAVAAWYLLIVLLSLARSSELPEKFWQGARAKYSGAEIAAARSVNPILFVFALIPIFWALFDQTNSTWVLQGEKMVPYQLPGFYFPTFDAISGWLHGKSHSPFEWLKPLIGAEQMQSANAALVMILVPLLTLGLYPRMGKLATPLRRMSIGLFLVAASYLIVAAVQKRIEMGDHISVMWQTVPYIVLTTAEVLVSTTGLEFAFTQAAPEMKSTVMSFWLLTVAFGNLMVSAITKVFPGKGEAAGNASVTTERFLLYAELTFAVALLFSVVAAFYRYRAFNSAGEPEEPPQV